MTSCPACSIRPRSAIGSCPIASSWPPDPLPRRGRGSGTKHPDGRIPRPIRLGPRPKAAFGGVTIANEKFTRETAERVVEAGEADAVAFGVQFIANPDLPRRFAPDEPLNEPNPATFYASGRAGYTDYPALELAAQAV